MQLTKWRVCFAIGGMLVIAMLIGGCQTAEPPAVV